MFFISKSSLLLLNHQILFWDILHCLFLCEIFPGGAGITITRWEIFRNFLVSCEIFMHIIYSVIFWDWLSCVRSFAGHVGIHTLCFLRYFQDVLLHCFCLCEICVEVMWEPIYSEIFWDFFFFLKSFAGDVGVYAYSLDVYFDVFPQRMLWLLGHCYGECICIHITFVCTYILERESVCACMSVCVLYVRIQTCKYTCRAWSYIYKYAYIYMHIYMNIYICICIQIYIYLYIYK